MANDILLISLSSPLFALIACVEDLYMAIKLECQRLLIIKFNLMVVVSNYFTNVVSIDRHKFMYLYNISC